LQPFFRRRVTPDVINHGADRVSGEPLCTSGKAVTMAQLQLATFNIGEHIFGINVLLIREINPNTVFTPVDLSPDYIRGLLNLRGQIITIIDPAVRLGMQQRDITPDSCCLVLKTTREVEDREDAELLAPDTVNDMVGLLVDSISDMVTANTRDIEQPPANIGDIDGRFIAGILKMDGRLLLVLKTIEILKDGK
jgi:purine-binding chemotaxis protein CheW